ncbi:MAG TPA: ribonuclease E activity regulator RraA [Candidatus Dormibacteraeota bacterium]|nr:ribonuclease E activity regulator RraA [Candidatus Dormibacteraeota bacterium]
METEQSAHATQAAQPATADLVDAYRESGRVQSCEIQFRHFGRRARFSGPIQTVRVFEDNVLVKRVLSTPGEGSVLVVDGGGSLRSALVGDVMAGLAVENGWAGLVVWGAVRDVAALERLEIGIKALGSNPWTSMKVGAGVVGVTLRFGNATFAPGHWLYADEDGVLVADGELR